MLCARNTRVWKASRSLVFKSLYATLCFEKRQVVFGSLGLGGRAAWKNCSSLCLGSLYVRHCCAGNTIWFPSPARQIYAVMNGACTCLKCWLLHVTGYMLAAIPGTRYTVYMIGDWGITGLAYSAFRDCSPGHCPWFLFAQGRNRICIHFGSNY